MDVRNAKKETSSFLKEVQRVTMLDFDEILCYKKMEATIETLFIFCRYKESEITK